MKCKFGLVILVCAFAVANLRCTVLADEASRYPRLGVYDPHRLLKDEKSIAIEHTFVYWQRFSPEQYQTFAKSAAERSREVMVTVEPWTRADNWTRGRETLLDDIINGGFDKEIGSVCRAVGASGSPVMVTWGHEMDEQEGRYPWANQNPEKYKKAFHYFVDHCRPLAPHARFGWTPKGEETLGAYYPSDDYVDFIGLKLFDLQAWNQDHQDWRSFEDKFDALHKQVASFGKPIVLAEFGVEGDDGFRQAALECALERIGAFDHLEAIVYFNDRETWRWPRQYGHPDWRIASGEFFECRPQYISTLMAPMSGLFSPVE
ncbi:glycoside hydrolase family 26 protein [Microvirga sp. TS319]